MSYGTSPTGRVTFMSYGTSPTGRVTFMSYGTSDVYVLWDESNGTGDIYLEQICLYKWGRILLKPIATEEDSSEPECVVREFV